MNASVLIVDDDKSVRMALRMALDGKYHTLSADSGAEALKQAEMKAPDMVLLDIGLPDIDGINVLRRLRVFSPDTVVIMITAVEEVKTIVEAVRLGAYDYLIKPVDIQDLLLTLQNAFENRKLKEQIRTIQKSSIEQYHYDVLEKSPKIRAAIQIARKVSVNPDIPVLITGESGSGKGVMAKTIHYSSSEKPGPFVTINCGAISAGLIESELFGYDRGAFTGAATEGKKGCFEAASGGTLLLDEIGAMPLAAQVKLLGVLEDRIFYRVGGIHIIDVAARIIAATNINLEAAVEQGDFRKDLFYRLNVVRIDIPPLRERREDIPYFINKFMSYFNAKFGKCFKYISPEAEAAFIAHHWPGNVRELRNMIERVILLEDDDTIRVEHLPFMDIIESGPELFQDESFDSIDYLEASKSLIQEALKRTGGNVLAASRLLNLPAHKLRYRIKKYEIKI
ncbi:MAG: sigma-54-dependent Fis family transcriptional regulator [Deltaproteobacteria bacterium]|nr:sigma-54-dependent Fis family transcriptional regulator [Deltaproteobacteria bacterium]